MMEVLVFAWNAIQTAGKILQFEGVMKFLIELFNDISPYTKKYSNFVNGIVKITEELGNFRKMKEFKDVYEMKKEMIEHLEKLEIDTKIKENIDMFNVRNILISDEKYVPIENFELFWQDIGEIKGLNKYLFAYKTTEIFIKEDEGDIIIRVINLMIECAVNRFFKK